MEINTTGNGSNVGSNATGQGNVQNGSNTGVGTGTPSSTSNQQPDRSRETRRSEIVQRLSEGGLPVHERTALEEELAQLDKDLRDNPSR